MTAATAAATAAAVPTATVAPPTDAKPKTVSKKEYKAPAPSAPAAPQDTEKNLVYVRCRKCSGGRAKVQFYHVVTLCMLLFVGYALLSVTLMLHNAIEKEVSQTYIKVTKYNELKQNYTSLQEMYNRLQKKMDALNNKLEEPRNNKIHVILQEDTSDVEMLRHSESTSETESTTQTETIIQKEVTTEKGAEEVTSNTDKEEKNQINIPSSPLPELLWINNNKHILDKIRLCLESRIC